MPVGVYLLRANAFQRPGETTAVYNKYVAGNSNVSTELYVAGTAAKVKHICDDRQPSALYTSDGGDKKLSDGTCVPITMTGASKYFANGLYDSSVTVDQTVTNASLRMGIRSTTSDGYYWTIFDNFRLYFFGQNKTVLGINSPHESSHNRLGVYYDLSGRRVTGMPSCGLYIKDGKKFVRTR